MSQEGAVGWWMGGADAGVGIGLKDVIIIRKSWKSQENHKKL